MKPRIEFKSILMANPFGSSLDESVPEGYIAVFCPHITLLSHELSKSVRAELKATWGSNTLPDFPEVTHGEPYFASNGAKESWVVDCIEQDAIRAWVTEVITLLGLDVTIDPSRVYHLSVANRTGSPYDSVPDPWNHRQ